MTDDDEPVPVYEAPQVEPPEPDPSVISRRETGGDGG